MPKVNLELGDVGCRKPGCKRRMEPTARHHRRCETMFIRAFKAYKPGVLHRKLCDRYDSFDPHDIIKLCAWHHCEIHLIYDRMISARKEKINKWLRDFTWIEADCLMRDLKKLCYEWEVAETVGVDPSDCASHKRFPRYRPQRKRSKRKT